MLFDSTLPETRRSADYDVAVVGAGTVGLFVAVLLARRGKRVLVLESGGRDFEAAAQELNATSVTGFPHNGATTGRARVLGGTSTLWGGQLTPLSPIDLARRPGFEHDVWPIGFEVLQEYYRKCASVLKLSRYVLNEQAIWQRLGISPPVHPALEVFVTHWLREQNLATVFRQDILELPNLDVVLHAHVVDLGWDGSAQRVDRIGYRSDASGELRSVRSENTLLANGTIEISRLLLLTAMDRAVPWAQNPWVGRCFQDHVDLNVARVVDFDGDRFQRYFSNVVLDGYKFQPKIRFSSRFLSDRALLNVACSFVFESSLAQDVQYLKVMVKSVLRQQGGWFRPREAYRHARGLSKVWLPIAYRYLVHRRIYNPLDRGISIVLHCEHMPSRDSYVGLDASRHDRFGAALAAVNWEFDRGSVARSAAAFCAELEEFLASNKLGRLQVDDALRNCDERILDRGRDTYHQSGGARMAMRAEDGVVDEHQRVFGTRNLYVVGAATFPTSSFANPTFTALALGLRLVEHLLGGEVGA